MFFNYCRFAAWPKDSSIKPIQTFAYRLNPTNKEPVAVFTNTDLIHEAELHRPNETLNETESWLTLIQNSNTPCPSDQTQMIKFKTDVLCDKTITGKGKPKIIYSNSCEVDCIVKVVLAHESGCSLIDASGFSDFLLSNEWIIGLLLIGAGLIVALKGRPFFRWVATIAVFLATSCFVILVCSLFPWMETKGGLATCIISAILIGALLAFLVYRFIWIGIGVLGMVGGYFLGTLLYFILFTFEKCNSIIVMLVISIFFSIIGGILAFKFESGVIIIGTSGMGSYLFMRGWSRILGGFPSEGAMIDALKDG